MIMTTIYDEDDDDDYDQNDDDNDDSDDDDIASPPRCSRACDLPALTRRELAWGLAR